MNKISLYLVTPVPNIVLCFKTTPHFQKRLNYIIIIISQFFFFVVMAITMTSDGILTNLITSWYYISNVSQRKDLHDSKTQPTHHWCPTPSPSPISSPHHSRCLLNTSRDYSYFNKLFNLRLSRRTLQKHSYQDT